jgi:hypothetical protein
MRKDIGREEDDQYIYTYIKEITKAEILISQIRLAVGNPVLNM